MNRNINHNSAIFYALLSAFSFSVSGLLVKLINHNIPDSIILFSRYALYLLFLFPMLLRNPEKYVSTKRIMLHLSRSLSGIASLGCFFAAVSNCGLINATFLVNTAPIFLLIILVFRRQQALNTYSIISLLLSFIGVILVFKPSLEVSYGLFLGLLAGFFGAWNVISIKKLSATEKSQTILFYYYLFASFFTGLWVIYSFLNNDFSNEQVWSITNILFLLAISIFGAVYQISITIALNRSSPSIVSPILYMSIVFSLFLGLFVLQENLSLLTFIGLSLIAFCSLMSCFFEIKRTPSLEIDLNNQIMKEPGNYKL